MEGLGEGYEAFLERLQSDFAVSKPSSQHASKSSSQNGSPNSFVSVGLGHVHHSTQDIVASSKANRAGFPSHLHLPPPKKYVGYPSPANAFTVKKDESSSPSESSIRPAARPIGDVTKDEKASPRGFPPISRTSSSDLNQVSNAPSYHRGHRRAQSEIDFRLPDDIIFDFEPGCLESSAEADELADDFISALDLEKMNILDAFSSNPAARNANNFTPVPSAPHHSRSFSVDQMFTSFNGNEDSFGHTEEAVVEKPRHRHSHSHSVDGSTSLQKEPSLTTADSSKSVSANKLAELALIDPKRAKRILANRQSAARSKERKMRYIAELERKVQVLQTEATALSAQLTIMQNDTTVLTAENNELKFQLKTLEQQTHLSNALNITLKEEVQRLKIATGEVATNGQFYRSQPPIADTLLSSQQLQQIRSALQKHQIINHQNIL